MRGPPLTKQKRSTQALFMNSEGGWLFDIKTLCLHFVGYISKGMCHKPLILISFIPLQVALSFSACPLIWWCSEEISIYGSFCTFELTVCLRCLMSHLFFHCEVSFRGHTMKLMKLNSWKKIISVKRSWVGVWALCSWAISLPGLS